MANTMVRWSGGTLYFDAVLHTDHNSSVTVTQHPVQTGAVVSDHAIVEPQEVSLEVGMSDVNGGEGSSVQAFQQFLSIMRERSPCTVVTRLNTYQNMILTSVAAPDDVTTMNALKCTLIFTQVRIVSVATIKVQETVSGDKPSVTPSPSTGDKPQDTNPGTEKPKDEKKQSVLKQATQKQYSTTINAETVQKAATAITSAVKSVVTGAVDAIKNAVKTAAATNAAKTATTQTTSKATTTAAKPVAAKVATLTSAKALAQKAASLLKK